MRVQCLAINGKTSFITISSLHYNVSIRRSHERGTPLSAVVKRKKIYRNSHICVFSNKLNFSRKKIPNKSNAQIFTLIDVSRSVPILDFSS